MPPPNERPAPAPLASREEGLLREVLDAVEQLERRNTSAHWLARAADAQLALEARPGGLDPCVGRAPLAAAAAEGVRWAVNRAIGHMQSHVGSDGGAAAFWVTADALARLATVFALPGWEAPYAAACDGLRRLRGAAATYTAL